MASTSSTITTLRPANSIPSAGISRVAVPYSSSYSVTHRRRQLASLANGQHAGAQPDREGAADQKPARVDTGDQVGAGRHTGQRVGHCRQAPAVGEQRG